MTRLIEANLPLYIQSLSVPSEWRRERDYRDPFHATADRKDQAIPLSLLLTRCSIPEESDDLLTVRHIRGGVAKGFDPWEKRTEFFGLQRGDTETLLAFL